MQRGVGVREKHFAHQTSPVLLVAQVPCPPLKLAKTRLPSLTPRLLPPPLPCHLLFPPVEPLTHLTTA